LQAKLALQGTVQDIRAQGALTLRELPVAAQARVALFEALPLTGFTLHATALELATLVDAAPNATLEITVEGEQVAARALQGTLTLRNPTPGTLDTKRLPLHALSARFAAEPGLLQQLDIDPGKLYFAGPLDNPGLDIRAMRKNQQVEAGVEVTGTARDPHVRLVSDPEVPDVEKLAWLTLGRPVEGRQPIRRADAAALRRGAGHRGGHRLVPEPRRAAGRARRGHALALDGGGSAGRRARSRNRRRRARCPCRAAR